DAVLDPLFWIDYDRTFQPHLATGFEMLNDTHLRIHLREGVKWQPDPDGNFTNEYFDAKDVYFTFYAWAELSNDQRYYEWIEEMKIINSNTLDIFIDKDPSTPENEPYAEFLERIAINILPEHYLNQSQYVSGDPDMAHVSWNTYATNCFGTGIFQFSEFKPSVETILTVNPDCWWLNSSITNDPSLDWINRFGDFTGGLTQLRVRNIPDVSVAQYEFEIGRIDVSPSGYSNPLPVDKFSTQSTIPNYITLLIYNVRPVREYIGIREPCNNDPSITKGLALRKAISYAINRDEINDIVHGGEYLVTDYPFFETMKGWCNPNIIRYNHDLDKAKYYIELIGYSSNSSIIGLDPSDLFHLTFSVLVVILLFKRKRKITSDYL
ncbi:MAG: ABC transporter substrate-binding protein, partial [Candidatus Heimdallarchaeota archaeon]